MHTKHIYKTLLLALFLPFLPIQGNDLKSIHTKNRIYLRFVNSDSNPDGPGYTLFSNGDYFIANWINGKATGPCLILKKNHDPKTNLNYRLKIIDCSSKSIGFNFDLNSYNDLDPSLCYIGDCINGLGFSFDDMFTYYLGSFSNGSQNGRGLLLITTGSVYLGTFSHGQFTGEGIAIIPIVPQFHSTLEKGIYIGTWKNFKPIMIKQTLPLPTQLE